MNKPLKVGEKLNNYEILKVLGQSELSTVYMARDEIQQKKWIIKEINPPLEDEDVLNSFKNRFIKICRQLSTLENNNPSLR